MNVVVIELPSQLTSKVNVQALKVAMCIEVIATRCAGPTLATKLTCLVA